MRRSAASVAALVVVFHFGQPALHEARAITLLHEFAGGADDGAVPLASLTLSGSTLFGTTFEGGDVGYGTVYSMNTDGSDFTLLHEFAGGANDGRNPDADLTLSGSTLFGTTNDGGNYSMGTILSINTDGSGFTLLHEFAGGVDGRYPATGLTQSGSTFFGATLHGGNRDDGTIFSINADGSGYRLVHEFADGRRPQGDLALSGSTLFGTTEFGGGSTPGMIFSIKTDGSDYTPLHEFAGGANDGADPLAGLTLSGSTLYGTTRSGGDNNRGTIFSISTDGSGFTLLHEFVGGADDGQWPQSDVTLSGSTLYGTTLVGGDHDLGTIFSINTDGSEFTLLHEFAGGADDGANSNVGQQTAGLTLSGSTLYGATERGGDFGLGTVFSIEIAEPGLAGDYNNNGTVDAADYVLWRKTGGSQDDYETWRAHFGETAGNVTPGDFNNDGSVDAADYVVWRKAGGTQDDYNTWRANFGRTAGSGSGSAGDSPSQTAVPEPVTLWLALAGVAIWMRLRVGHRTKT